MRHDCLSHPPGAAPEQGESLARSDEAVRKALVETRQQLLSFLRRKLGNAEEADDVLQAFMLRAIERSGQLNDIESVRGWLSRVLASSITDHQRSMIRRRSRETVMNPEDLEKTAAESNLEVDEVDEVDEVVCDCLYQLLPTLKLDYAELIERIDLLGEPREIVAVCLGITINNLNVKLHRARQALKRRLEEMCTACLANGFLDCGCNADRHRREQQDG